MPTHLYSLLNRGQINLTNAIRPDFLIIHGENNILKKYLKRDVKK